MFRLLKSRLLLGIILYILCLQMPASGCEITDAVKKILLELPTFRETLKTWFGDNDDIERRTYNALEARPDLVRELKNGPPTHMHQIELLKVMDIFKQTDQQTDEVFQSESNSTANGECPTKTKKPRITTRKRF